MGRANRSRPKRLGEKLRLIRTRLGLTQAEMVARLKVKGENLYPSSISLFENGVREPSLLTLLAYSNVSGHSINDLVDDKVRLSSWD